MKQGYRLGREVTEQARAREARGTVVVSCRLSAIEFDALSELAEQEDRAISEILRHALRRTLYPTADTSTWPSKVWFD